MYTGYPWGMRLYLEDEQARVLVDTIKSYLSAEPEDDDGYLQMIEDLDVIQNLLEAVLKQVSGDR